MFAREVGSCLQYLTESPDWKPNRVCVHRESNSTTSGSGSEGVKGSSDGSGHVYGTHTNKVSIFECTELGDRRTNSGMWHTLEECVAQYSACIIETGVVLPEADSVLSKAQLVKVFEQVVYRGSNNTSSNSDNVVSSNKFYSADFNDVKHTGRSGSNSTGGGVSSPRSVHTKSKRNAGVSNNVIGAGANADSKGKHVGLGLDYSVALEYLGVYLLQ